jgi:hypothetical protein
MRVWCVFTQAVTAQVLVVTVLSNMPGCFAESLTEWSFDTSVMTQLSVLCCCCCDPRALRGLRSRSHGMYAMCFVAGACCRVFLASGSAPVMQRVTCDSDDESQCGPS